MKEYFEKVGDKACCFEDLKPYLDLTPEDLAGFKALLEAVPSSFVSRRPLIQTILSYRIPCRCRLQSLNCEDSLTPTRLGATFYPKKKLS